MQRLSRLTDQALARLWSLSGLDAPFALLAVGGLGRGELFPYSDVDVVVLLPDGHAPESDAMLTEQLEKFIGACWDCGLEIGSSVRTVSQCLNEAAKDVTVQTALLEFRLITGSVALANQFRQAFFEAMDAKAFFVAKTLEMLSLIHI